MEIKLVKDIMVKRVATIDMDDTLRDIGELFRLATFHHLVVLDEGRLAGLISDRDYFKEISPFVGTVSERPIDAASLEKRAHLIMQHNVVTVTPDTPINEATRLILDRGLSCLPVVNAFKKVVGILTWKDLLRNCLSSRSAKPV